MPRVRADWQGLRALQAEVGALFPESSSADDTGPNDVLARLWPTPNLPHIPGYEVQEVVGHGGMGIVYKAWHLRLKRAIAALEKCLRLQPMHCWAHAALGSALRAKGRTDEAINHLRIAILFDSPRVFDHKELARALQDKQHPPP